MFLAIKAFFDSITAGFNFGKVKTEKQAETYAIKDAKKLQKATDTAEDMIVLYMKYASKMTEEDRKKLLRLIQKFKKYN